MLLKDINAAREQKLSRPQEISEVLEQKLSSSKDISEAHRVF